MRSIAVLFAVAVLAMATGATAGPNDASRFDASRYEPQKALYDFNLENVEDIDGALGYVRNHLRALKEFGDPARSRIVIVAHGNEIHALSRRNRAAFPQMYDQLKTLAQSGVTIRICRNAATARGYKPEDFYDLVTVVPAAFPEIAKWQGEGYQYMFAAWYPRLTRDELVAAHAELKAQ
jgi:intracellular sulfur oxidation DsrE/DsrF family protein